MLPGLIPFPPTGAVNGNLLESIQAAGQATNLKLCLDVGDATSYGGSGQVWSDLSGNGYDFTLGLDATVDGGDATFNGSAGGLGNSTYWSFDGNDYFRYDSANEAWMNVLHKDNAAFSVLAVIYPASTSLHGIFGTGNATTNQSVRLAIGAAPTFIVNDGSAPASLSVTGDTALTASAWHVLGLSIDEAGNTGFFYLDGAYNQVSASNTFAAAYSAPGTGNATFRLEIGAIGNAQLPMQSGARMACFAMWDRALSKANFDSIWTVIRGRFGL